MYAEVRGVRTGTKRYESSIEHKTAESADLSACDRGGDFDFDLDFGYRYRYEELRRVTKSYEELRRGTTMYEEVRGVRPGTKRYDSSIEHKTAESADLSACDRP